jgi:hypothetical protein
MCNRVRFTQNWDCNQQEVLSFRDKEDCKTQVTRQLLHILFAKSDIFARVAPQYALAMLGLGLWSGQAKYQTSHFHRRYICDEINT